VLPSQETKGLVLSDGIWPERQDYDRAAGRAVAALTERGIEARMVGSYDTGTFVVPYSDIDVLAVATEGNGPAVRDAVVEAAHSMEDAVCVTIDPFSDEAIVYSILTTGLQIDWFIVERVNGRERAVWRGASPQPIDIACRAWSSLLYTLALLLKSDSAESRRSAARDLAEHWVWLSAQGIDASSFAGVRPDMDDGLFALIGKTADVLPPAARLSRILHSRLSNR
jgi:hypothetical protein